MSDNGERYHAIFHVVLNVDSREELQKLIDAYADKWKTIPMDMGEFIEFVVTDCIESKLVFEAILSVQ